MCAKDATMSAKDATVWAKDATISAKPAAMENRRNGYQLATVTSLRRLANFAGNYRH